MNSKDAQAFDILDILAIISFYMGYINYTENVSQGQMQEAINDAIGTLQEHLEEQDDKINKILSLLNKTGGEVVE